MKVQYSFFVSAVVLLMVINSVIVRAIYCPDYCDCYVANGLRSVSCVGKGLVNVYVDIHTSVQYLNLSRNHITFIEDNAFKVQGLTMLEVLDLSRNFLGSLGLNFLFGLTRLKKLDLSHNSLSYLLSGVTLTTPNLVKLSLSGNPIKKLPQDRSFLVSRSIKELDLSNCILGDIPEFAFSSMTALSILNLSGNSLVTLSYNFFYSSPQLISIDLSRNQLICDSHISQLSDWLKNNQIEFVGSPCLGFHKGGNEEEAEWLEGMKQNGDLESGKMIALNDANDSDSEDNEVSANNTEGYWETNQLSTIKNSDVEPCRQKESDEWFLELGLRTSKIPLLPVLLMDYIFGIISGVLFTMCCCWAKKKELRYIRRREPQIATSLPNPYSIQMSPLLQTRANNQSSAASSPSPTAPPPSYYELFFSTPS